MAKIPLVRYTVSIIPPRENMTNQEMDEALRTWEATAEYRDNLRRVISARFVDGVDSLGEAGFLVEVLRD